MDSPTGWVLSVVKTLVDRPEDVEARWVPSAEGGLVELKVHPQDRGKVIGKRGRTIQALRTVASAAGPGPVGVELVE
jgi:uncharacterized protein